MALATLTGTIRDHSGSSVGTNLVLLFHPQRPGARGSMLLTDSPVEASLVSNSWTVQLEDLTAGAEYTAEARWVADGRDRSWWSKPFKVPVGGGAIGSIMDLPAQNGMVWVEDDNLNTSRVDQYQYVSADGWLYERTA